MPWLWNLWLERCGHILDTVRMLVGTAPVTARAHPAWVRSHDLAAGIGSHHACGRMGVLRCWADSDSAPRGRSRPPLREDGKAGPRAGLSRPGQPRRQPDASRSTCRPYPHSTGPGLTRLGAGLHRAGRCSPIAGSTHVGHPSPRRDVNVRGARPLSASQAGFGLSTGGSPALQRQVGARANRCCAWSAAEGDSDGSHWDAAPSWRPTHVDPAVSVNLPAGQASGGPRGPRARLDPPRVRKVRPSGGPLPHASGPGWQERQVAKPVAISGP